jgi:hypothetical protein
MGALFLLEGGKTIDDFNKHFKILDTPTFNHELFQYPYLVKEFMETVTGVTRLVQGSKLVSKLAKCSKLLPFGSGREQHMWNHLYDKWD